MASPLLNTWVIISFCLSVSRGCIYVHSASEVALGKRIGCCIVSSRGFALVSLSSHSDIGSVAPKSCFAAEPVIAQFLYWMRFDRCWEGECSIHRFTDNLSYSSLFSIDWALFINSFILLRNMTHCLHITFEPSLSSENLHHTFYVTLSTYLLSTMLYQISKQHDGSLMKHHKSYKPEFWL